MFLISFCNCISCPIHGLIQLTWRIVSASGMHCRKIISDIDAQAVDVAQIAIFNAPAKISLEDNFLEYTIQPRLIAPVGSCCKAQKHTWGEVIKHTPVCTGSCVVTLIANDCVKVISAKSVQALCHRHNRRTHNLSVWIRVFFCHFNAGFAVVFLKRLPDQFFTVGQN